jgi:hypothetical protein
VGRITPFADTNEDGVVDNQDSSDNNGDGVVDDGDRIVFDANGNPVGIMLLQALTDILGLTHVDLDLGPDVTDEQARRSSFATQTLPVRLEDTNGDGAIDDQDASVDVRTVTRVREVENDLEAREAWILLTRDGYNPLQPTDEVVLTRGNGVSLVFTVDHDGDTVPRSLEVLYGSSDDNTDSDGDGLADNVEIQQSYDVFVVGQEPRAVLSSPGRRDTDGDGLDDAQEREAGTAANDVDTDNDGLSDLDEVERGTDPLDPDTDDDGLIDGVEVRLGSNPDATDTDSDGVDDRQEVRRGTNPAIADHLVTVTYTSLRLGIGACDGPGVPGEFTFEFRVDIPMFSAPPEDELVVSAETVGVRFCGGDSDPGPCKTVVNDQIVLRMSSPTAGTELPINASVRFPVRFDEVFRVHGFVRELDDSVVDLNFSFEQPIPGSFHIILGRDEIPFGFSRDARGDCEVDVFGNIRAD